MATTNHQCPRCHLKFTRETVCPGDNTTYWQNCSTDCLMGREKHIELKVVGAPLPTKGYDDDCGFDLYCHIDKDRWMGGTQGVGRGEFADIDCGVAIELPPGIWGLITGRSSAIRKRGLLVVNGIIDTGYRGRLFMPVINMGQNPVFIEHGERIGQLILMQNMSLGVEIRAVDFLSPSARGEKGFGSTGK